MSLLMHARSGTASQRGPAAAAAAARAQAQAQAAAAAQASYLTLANMAALMNASGTAGANGKLTGSPNKPGKTGIVAFYYN
jgi:hypothetical protein